jgi:bifunctional ADP-heptose synthase (sugar kinase/adenylyltransferase)
VGALEVKSWGGRIVRVPMVPGLSTSAIIAAIRREG